MPSGPQSEQTPSEPPAFFSWALSPMCRQRALGVTLLCGDASHVGHGRGASRRHRSTIKRGLMRKAPIAVVALLGLVITPGLWSPAVAASKGARTRAFSEIHVGAMISMNGLRFESVYRVKRSPDGAGAAIQDGTVAGTTFPLSGRDSVATYFADGVRLTTDSFVLTPPHTDGIGTIIGSGKCVGGTGIHTTEKCSYTITGTYSTQTTVVKMRIAGTDTR
jgi:hypothetical protein